MQTQLQKQELFLAHKSDEVLKVLEIVIAHKDRLVRFGLG